MPQVFHPLPTDLHLEYSLVCGQTFRWSCTSDAVWHCVLYDATRDTHVQVRLCQRAEAAELVGPMDSAAEAFLWDYFRMEVDVSALAEQWQRSDIRIADAVSTYAGLRVLRQDPVECVFSFICASASPLHRIRRSIGRICEALGHPAAGNDSAPTTFTFPTLHALATVPENELRSMGLGYRARYIVAAANEVIDHGGEPWLRGLRNQPYADAKQALMQLTGIGDKIADCICLFSLDKDDAVPVDTHVRTIVCRDYADAAVKAHKNPSNGVIADAFRRVYPDHPGWAQQYLFFDEVFQRKAWNSYVTQVQSEPEKG